MKVKGLKVGAKLEIGDLKLRTGVYIMSSPTAGGKTTTCIKLLAYISGRTSSAVEMYYVGEPESEEEMTFEDLKATAITKNRVYIIDSMTMAMLKVASDAKGQVIFKGGLLPAYVVTLLDLNIHCIKRGVCVIITMNETLFPVVDLSGATQGRIDISGRTSVRVSDRSNRAGYTFNFPSETLAKAAEFIKAEIGSSEHVSSGSVTSASIV